MKLLQATNSDKPILVDDADYEWLSEMNWTILKKPNSFYAKTRIGVRPYKYKSIQAMILPPPERMLVDHIDRDGLNNQRSNLRICTYAQNNWNRTPIQKYKGVFLHKRLGRWQARIMAHGKRFNLGFYDTPEEAALAYDNAAKQLHGEFAYINFPNIQ